MKVFVVPYIKLQSISCKSYRTVSKTLYINSIFVNEKNELNNEMQISSL